MAPSTNLVPDLETQALLPTLEVRAPNLDEYRLPRPRLSASTVFLAGAALATVFVLATLGWGHQDSPLAGAQPEFISLAKEKEEGPPGHPSVVVGEPTEHGKGNGKGKGDGKEDSKGKGNGNEDGKGKGDEHGKGGNGHGSNDKDHDHGHGNGHNHDHDLPTHHQVTTTTQPIIMLGNSSLPLDEMVKDCFHHMDMGTVFKSGPCMERVAQEHAEKGYAVSLKEFEKPVPSVWAWIFSVLVGLIVIAGVIASCLGGASVVANNGVLLVPDSAKPDVVKGEVVIQVWQQILVAIIGILAGSCLGVVPAWVSVPLMAFPVLRALALDLALAGPSGAANLLSPVALMKLFMSKLEVLDATSDGLAVAAVFLLESSENHELWSARMAAAWGNSWLLPIMGNAHSLSMAMLALLTVVLAPNVFMAFTADNSTLMELSGLGFASASHAGKGGVLDEAMKLMLRITFEAIPQLWLQGSAVMISGQGLFTSPQLAFSIFMSYITGTLKMISVVHKICSKPTNTNSEQEASMFCGIFVLAIVGMIVCYNAFYRVIKAEECDSLIWGTFTGCVVAPTMVP